MKNSKPLREMYDFGYSFLIVPVDNSFQGESDEFYDKTYRKSPSKESKSTSFDSSNQSEGECWLQSSSLDNILIEEDQDKLLISFTSILSDDWMAKAKKTRSVMISNYLSQLEQKPLIHAVYKL